MKNLLLVIMFLFSAIVFADNGPVGRSTTLDAAGALSGNLEQWFINVKNGSGGALVDGNVVIADVSADDGYTVTTSSTAGAIPLCVIAEACASGAVCKCQTYGYKSNVQFDVTAANAVAGKLATISESNAGYVAYDSGIAATDYPVGVFYDAASASGDIELFIRLR